MASIWGAPKLGLGVMRRVPLYFLFGEPATTVGQSRPSREAPASGEAKKKLRRKARALATRGKPRAVQSRKGVVRTATKVIAPAGAARGSRKSEPRKSLSAASRAVSDERHFARHASRKKAFCLRCDFYSRRNAYTALARAPNGSSWLASRFVHGWGLGCLVCAEAVAAGASTEGRFSKFANFKFRAATARCHAIYQITQHWNSRAHRDAAGERRTRRREKLSPQPLPLACDAAPLPDDKTEEVAATDAALLQGNVPSAAEWRDAWAMLSETTSLRKCARVRRKQFSADADPTEARTRKRRRKQLCIMAEVLRAEIRDVLRNATSISLSLDESRYVKVIRYRADVPASGGGGGWARNFGASGYCHIGVLGALDCSKRHAADFEEDHAVTAVNQLDSFLTKLCTPLGRRGIRKALPLACDESLKSHVMRTVTSVSADGASKERRAVFLAARDLFPNLLLVIRDPAHAIRIAAKSLHCDDVFGDVWHALFDGRHALAPDIMNSAKWHNLFVAIQQDNILPLAEPGIGRKPLDRVVRNLSFAKQRFNSTAGPVGKIALMLLPVATLLAYISSDVRHDAEMRERAKTLLKKLDTKWQSCILAQARFGALGGVTR